jgi:lathosterol oxidase
MTLILILIPIIFFRYVLLSIVIEKIITRSDYEKVFTFNRPKDQRKKEILLSFYSSIIFAIGFYGLYYLWEIGVIRLTDESYTWYYHVLSVMLALFIHETYYYWLHRLMHHPKLYRFLHKGHHDSIEVSSWTAFSFDPLETIFQVLPFYLITLLIPLHLYSILFLLIFMSISATINHLNHEVYPQEFKNHIVFKHFIGATHHALHHKEFKTNYGLYFTFWDKWMKTQSKNY